jgi:hypothetical protein
MRRWSTAVAATLGVALAIYPLTVASEGPGAAAIGLGGLVCMTLALASRRARGLTIAAAVLLAFHYAVALHAASVELDLRAPLFAIGLFAFIEAADLSIALADVAPIPGAVLAARLRTTALIGVAGGGLALLSVLARSLFAGAIASVVLGAVCVLGIVALPLWIAQRPRP